MEIEEFLQESRRLWRFLVENTRDLICITDPAGVVRYATPSHLDILGYHPHELVGESFFVLVHPDDLEKALSTFAEGMGEHKTMQTAGRYRHRDGQTLWVEATGMPLVDEEGKLIGGVVVSRDITGQVESEEVLRESEERYRMLFHRSPVGVFYYDPGLILTDCNDRFVEVLQTSRDRLIGLDLTLLRDQAVLPAIRRALGGEEGAYEGPYNATTSQAEIWVSLRTAALYDRKGGIAGGIGIVEDVTERKEAESLLRQQKDLALKLAWASSLEETLEHSLEAVLEATGFDGGGVYLLNEETGGLDLACSRGLSDAFVAEVYTYPADSPNVRLVMTGNPVYKSYEDLEMPVDDVRRREGLKAMAVAPVLHLGRVIGDVNIASRVMTEVPKGARNAVETMAGQIGQAIARARLDSALRESEARYRAVFEASGSAMCVLDALGGIVFTNREFTNLSGYSYESLEVGLRLGDVLRSRGEEEVMRSLKGLKEGAAGAQQHLLLRLACSGGGEKDVLASMGLLPGRNAAVLSFIDVTREREYEMELEERARQLTDFLAVASHELRHPITLIRGYSETMMEAWRDGQERTLEEIVAAVESSSYRLMHLVEELLDVSRIEEGRFPVQKEAVPLESVVREAAEEMRERYAEWEIDVRVGEGLPSPPLDPERVRQLLVILLENAVHFSPRGSRVEVAVEVEDGRAVVSVADRGVGVPEGDRARVFERFYQVEDLNHHSAPGLGMGLFIASNIVEAHGGRIWCEERSGGGTVFLFTLHLED